MRRMLRPDPLFLCRRAAALARCGRLWLAPLWLAAMALPAAAEFAVCNQSFDVVNVAIAQDVTQQGDAEDTFETKGWWTIGPNQCANVIREELVSRYIYVYAQDVFGQPILNGTTEMCVSPRRFTIRGTRDCWIRGHVTAGFIEVDTVKTQRWTLFLTATP